MRATPPPLLGQVALVTGATRGLGRALAVALADAGADVAILGRDAATGAETAGAVERTGRRALMVTADVADEAQMATAVEQASAAFGQIDILVCAAGIGAAKGPLWESAVTDYRAIFDVNVLGTLLAMRAVLPAMVGRGSGRVVVIGGTFGHKGVANFGLYAASKWALRGLVKSAALEAGPHGVTVNIVAPGGIDGERLRAQFARSAETNGEAPEAVLARFVGGTALGRLVTPQDVAASVLYLVGDAGRQITGQDIVVDAGAIV